MMIYLLQNSKSFLLFFITILVHNFGSIICQPTYNYHSCLGANFSSASFYQSNLQSLMDSLFSKSSLNSFYTDSLNETYGLFLCRGDVNSTTCQTCVKTATQSLPQRCPSSKEAVIWFDECLLHYSDTNFSGIVTTSPQVFMWNTQNQTDSSSNGQNFGVLGFVYTLIDQAQNSQLLFGAQENVSQKRYGLVQCSRDLNGSSCNSCLQPIASAIRGCCEYKKGWRILSPSCFVRYEEYPFFQEPVVSPPVPSAPGPMSIGGNKGKGKKKVVIITVSSLAAVLVLVLAGFMLFSSYRKKGQKGEGTGEEILLRNSQSSRRSHMMEEGINEVNEDHSGGMNFFGLAEIQGATNNFSDANKLGEGGFGPVYKGKMPNGKEVAVKRLSMGSSQGLQEFKNEVKLIIKLQHKNLVRLLGYCLEEDEKLLVYEYMANTSLDAFLFDSTKCKLLDWETRANIINGTAKGLQYLHEDSRLKIIHRDLKASNILLDDEMNPKISDFGTARIFGGKQMEANTERVVGTFGYMAPEYALEGLFSVKSDVYSFGILMLEILSGKKNRGFHHSDCGQSLLTYAWKLWNEGKALELVDPNIVIDCPLHEVLRRVQIALLCVQDDPALRPTMSAVVLMLGSKSVNLPQPSAPPFSATRFTAQSDDSSTSGRRTGTSDQSSTFST
ncbi:hypothetical protein SLA2020_472160 [Shorea laevis]